MMDEVNTELLSYATDSKITPIAVQMTRWSEFQDVDKVLKSNGEEWFYELRDVLKKHNALDRFGITLLHKHFDVADDEIMLETTDVGNRTLHMQPIKTKDYFDKETMPLVATSIRLIDCDNLTMQVTMWSQFDDAYGATRISDKDVTCLSELRDVLKTHDALNRFGIKLLLSQFEVAKDETLLETTDVKERTQIIKPVKINGSENSEDASGMITQWKLVEGETIAVLVCRCDTWNGKHTGGHRYE